LKRVSQCFGLMKGGGGGHKQKKKVREQLSTPKKKGHWGKRGSHKEGERKTARRDIVRILGVWWHTREPQWKGKGSQLRGGGGEHQSEEKLGKKSRGRGG